MNVFGLLQELRERPIPSQAEVRLRPKGYRKLPIMRDNARFSEPLAEVRLHGIAGQNFYNHTHNPPYWCRIAGSVPELLAREGVISELIRINARLGEAGLELFVLDAWRPRAVQVYFHDVWMPGELKRRNPLLEGEELWREVERYWAAPSIDAGAPAPHATGAALDLTIRWKDAEQLWMGSLFDDVSSLSHRDRFEMDEAAFSFSDEEARANRRLLHWVMSEAGFAGHPDEWWHYSLGDQLWAALTGRDAAWYGLARED